MALNALSKSCLISVFFIISSILIYLKYLHILTRRSKVTGSKKSPSVYFYCNEYRKSLYYSNRQKKKRDFQMSDNSKLSEISFLNISYQFILHSHAYQPSRISYAKFIDNITTMCLDRAKGNEQFFGDFFCGVFVYDKLKNFFFSS